MNYEQHRWLNRNPSPQGPQKLFLNPGPESRTCAHLHCPLGAWTGPLSDRASAGSAAVRRAVAPRRHALEGCRLAGAHRLTLQRMRLACPPVPSPPACPARSPAPLPSPRPLKTPFRAGYAFSPHPRNSPQVPFGGASMKRGPLHSHPCVAPTEPFPMAQLWSVHRCTHLTPPHSKGELPCPHPAPQSGQAHARGWWRVASRALHR